MSWRPWAYSLHGDPALEMVMCDEVYAYTITVPDDCGRSSSCEWVRTLWCSCNPYCTMTQGFYGNIGGLYCGETTPIDMLEDLMSSGPLTIGQAGLNQSFTIQPSECACILTSLPGGGESSILRAVKGSFDANCIPSNINHTDGNWDNTLAAQTLTLSLNVQIPDDPMANDALGGENPGNLNLGDVTEALKSINNGFDKCRILSEFFSTPPVDAIAIDLELPNVIFDEGYEFTLWPNPTSGEVILSLNKTPESDLTVEVYDHVGRLVRVDRMTDIRQTYDLGNLSAGMYLVRVSDVEGRTQTKKLIITD